MTLHSPPSLSASGPTSGKHEARAPLPSAPIATVREWIRGSDVCCALDSSPIRTRGTQDSHDGAGPVAVEFGARTLRCPAAVPAARRGDVTKQHRIGRINSRRRTWQTPCNSLPSHCSASSHIRVFSRRFDALGRLAIRSHPISLCPLPAADSSLVLLSSLHSGPLHVFELQ